ncbi:MAG: hypothetical protein ACI8RP_000208 [Urechidicola sp.]|jgi:uncharacterized protein YydD (DUF2326 family)
MKLNSLIITIDKNPVRSVIFKDGLNIVTNKKGIGRSGNSVGKSTLSRVVDFLFLGSIEPIYIDEEFKNPNKKIESLLENSVVEAELSFIGVDNKLHQIVRNLTINKDDSTFFVDGLEKDKKEYEKQLQFLFFNISTRRPSVRALAPKFIRNDGNRMLNTTKFLDKHSGSKDYSELFLYLFGFENTNLLTEKRDATNLINRRKRNSTSLNAIVREQKPSKLVHELREKINSMENQFLKFDYSPDFDDPITYLTQLQEKEDLFSDNLMKIERKILNIKNTIQILSNQGGNHLSKELKEIYEFAGVAIESGARKYEEVLAFHDNLVAKKRQYLSTDLPSLNGRKEILISDLNKTHSEKAKVFTNMRSREHINRITENLKELGQLKIDLGRSEGVIDQQNKAISDLSEAEKSLAKILESMNKEFTNIDIFEKHFNKEFERITELVLADKYNFNLNFDKEKGSCKLEIDNQIPNPEGGRKKAEVIAFDFSYIYAVNTTGSLRPSFIIHDSIEDIDQKQIDLLFEQSRILPGQQIISLLSENLSQEFCDKYDKDVVLYLTEDEMFFKV